MTRIVTATSKTGGFGGGDDDNDDDGDDKMVEVTPREKERRARARDATSSSSGSKLTKSSGEARVVLLVWRAMFALRCFVAGALAQLARRRGKAQRAVAGASVVSISAHGGCVRQPPAAGHLMATFATCRQLARFGALARNSSGSIASPGPPPSSPNVATGLGCPSP